MWEDEDRHIRTMSMICFGLMSLIALLLFLSAGSYVWDFFAA
jgi:hypothetical protein